MNMIANLCFFFLGINTLIFTYSLFKNKSKELVYFTCYSWAIALVQLFMELLVKMKATNLFLSHFYFVLQFLFVSLLFYHAFAGLKFRQLIKYLLVVVLVLLAAQYIWKPNLFFKFNTTEILLTSLPLIVYAAAYLYNSLEVKRAKWLFFSAGLFVYLLSSTLLFSGWSVMLEKYLGQGLTKSLSVINTVLYLCYQVVITIEWFVNFRKPEPDINN